MNLTLTTDDGREVAKWSNHADRVDREFYLPSGFDLRDATCLTNQRARDFLPHFRRLLTWAEDLEAGRDPERPSEKAMRLASEGGGAA